MRHHDKEELERQHEILKRLCSIHFKGPTGAASMTWGINPRKYDVRADFGNRIQATLQIDPDVMVKDLDGREVSLMFISIGMIDNVTTPIGSMTVEEAKRVGLSICNAARACGEVHRLFYEEVSGTKADA